MKNTFDSAPTDQINQYLVNLHYSWPIVGVSTWPWDNLAKTKLGGIILDPTYGWNSPATETLSAVAAHEMAHAFGLYHTHRGASEIRECTNPCYEFQPATADGLSSDITGDMCSDTRPTAVNFDCGDPSTRDCGNNLWVNTPYQYAIPR
jgi:hypothetical protein